MSIFDGTRLTNGTFKLDVERMRRGWYSDKYFSNVTRTLASLAFDGYRFGGDLTRLSGLPINPGDIATGDIQAEMQFFTRRRPFAVIAGVDKALSILRHCAGYFEEVGDFVGTWDQLEVEAVHDGVLTHYNGDPMHVQPVIKVRGRYRDFALLETPMLGALARASRVATNVHNTLVAARGKPVLFFPARFDAHEVQAADGYAYDIAVRRFNLDYGEQINSLVSTDAQGDWWGSYGGGTIAHAAIACFLGDLIETMLVFARTQPPEIPRIALVDFNNDSVRDSLGVLRAYFNRYWAALKAGDESEAQRWVLYGVRLDTSGSLRDVSVAPLGDKRLDMGVSPRLVWRVRQALDRAWESWELPPDCRDRAADYCRRVRIVVSGGFNPEKISWFEESGVPVDAYGVGSSLMSNDSTVGTSTDFTADVVRVRVAGQWIDMAKVGRTACSNPDLEPVDLIDL